MAKKKTRRIQAPSLSTLDKVIYYLLIVCSVTASVFVSVMVLANFRRSVFEDTKILAHQNTGEGAFLFLSLAIGGGLALFWDRLRMSKQPIFGKANIKYGPPQWKTVYPMATKKFWIDFFADKRRAWTKILCAVAFLSIFITAASLALPPRTCLNADGSILVYNCLDQKVAEYHASDIEQIRIYTTTYRQRHGFSGKGIKIEIYTKDGEAFSFSQRYFRRLDENIHGAISGIYQIKTLFDTSKIKIEGKENIAQVVHDMKLNQQEVELLYLIFDAGEPSAAEQ